MLRCPRCSYYPVRQYSTNCPHCYSKLHWRSQPIRGEGDSPVGGIIVLLILAAILWWLLVWVMKFLVLPASVYAWVPAGILGIFACLRLWQRKDDFRWWLWCAYAAGLGLLAFASYFLAQAQLLDRE